MVDRYGLSVATWKAERELLYVKAHKPMDDKVAGMDTELKLFPANAQSWTDVTPFGNAVSFKLQAVNAAGSTVVIVGGKTTFRRDLLPVFVIWV